LLVALICFLLWIARLDGGIQLLGGLGFWLLAAVIFIGMVRLFSHLLGTPGERNHHSNRTSRDDSNP
jgi:hypothetical protein